MSLDLLEQAAEVLGELVDDVVFVGGATLDAYVTEAGAIPFRGTVDVDVVIEAATRAEYERFAELLRARGITEDATSSVICRFRHGASGLLIDVMGRDEQIFGFANRWYDAVLDTAEGFELPSGRVIRASGAAALLATKVAAFLDRGASYPLASHDLDDIVRLVDTRPELVDEVAAADAALRDWIREQVQSMLADRLLVDAMRGQMPGDAGSQRRFEEVVLPRLRQIASA